MVDTGMTLPSSWNHNRRPPWQDARQQEQDREADTEHPSVAGKLTGSGRLFPQTVGLRNDPSGEAYPVRIPPPIAPTKGPRAKALCAVGQYTKSRGTNVHSSRGTIPLQEANLGGVPSKRLICGGPQRKRAWRKRKQEEKRKRKKAVCKAWKKSKNR